MKLIPVLRHVAPLVLGALVLGGDLAAQASDEQIKADIEFARGLASRFVYVDLAEELIAEIEKGRLTKELTEELGVAKCDIYYVGAKNERDKDKRLGLYDKAMTSYEAFIDDNPFSDFLPEAKGAYVDLCNAYSNVIERAIGETLGDEAEALRTLSRSVLEKGLEHTGEMLDRFPPNPDDMTAEEKLDKARLMLNRGQMLITFAKVSEEGTFMFGMADKILEEVALEYGESTGWGLNAYILLAKSKIAQGDYTYAADFGEYVVDLMVPLTQEKRDEDDWDAIPVDFKAKRWELVERASADLISSLVAIGNVSKACEFALHYHNSWKREGFILSPIGYLSLLEVGRTLLASGGYVGGSIAQGELQWFETEEAMNDAGYSARRNSRSATDLALGIAQQVNEENKTNILKVYAQKLISEIRDLPGIVLAPEVLFEAAQGEYNAKNYHEANVALRGVLRALDSQDEATKRGFLPRVLWYLGRSYEKTKRPLEAAMVFKEAVTTWRGDLEFDEKNARGYYTNIGDVRRAAPGDTRVNQMWLEAEEIVVDVQKSNTGDIVWRQAERLYKDDEFEQAREKYLQVEEQQNNYERAIAKAALCLYKIRDVDGAKVEFLRYIEEFLPDPTHVVNTPQKKLARQMAKAQVVFYLGRIAYSNADYERVIELYTGFEKEFPDQTSYAPNALYMLLMSHLGLRNFEAAEATHAILRDTFPTENVTGRGALQMYNLVKAEQEAALAAGDADRAHELLRKMAEYMNISNSLTAEGVFSNLHKETSLWIDLEEWANAETAARRAIDTAGPEEEDTVTKHLMPALGLGLLRQKRVDEAFEILDPLVPDPDDKEDPRRVSAEVTANWCRAVCGWIEGDENNIVEVPGVGDAATIEKASKLWLRLTNKEKNDGNQWEEPWYALKFELFHCWYRWGLVDSTKSESCLWVVYDLVDYAGPTFGDIEAKCGNRVLQKRYQWLWDKVR